MNLQRLFRGKRKVFDFAKEVRDKYGKSLLSQFAELVRLRFSTNEIGFQDYYDFGLYDDSRYSFADKLRFVGFRKESDYGQTLNARPWNVVTSDKLVAYAIFKGLGLPFPKILAVYHPFGRRFPGAECFTKPEELSAYLRSGVTFPFFSKPAHGASGRNSVACVGYDEANDSLILANGGKVGVETFVDGAHPIKGAYPWEAGFIFQELVKPAPEWEEAFGPKVPGFRMVVFNPDSKPRIFRAVLKVPVAGKSMIDNFESGTTGTLLAAVDAETGVILNVRGGVPPRLSDIVNHPDTGRAMIGFQIPRWNEYLELVDYAVQTFPGVRLQHWDIAVSDRGPMIYEMNTFGGFGLPQIAFQRGYFDEQFEKFFVELGKEYPAYRRKGDY